MSKAIFACVYCLRMNWIVFIVRKPLLGIRRIFQCEKDNENCIDKHSYMRKFTEHYSMVFAKLIRVIRMSCKVLQPYPFSDGEMNPLIWCIFEYCSLVDFIYSFNVFRYGLLYIRDTLVKVVHHRVIWVWIFDSDDYFL